MDRRWIVFIWMLAITAWISASAIASEPPGDGCQTGDAYAEPDRVVSACTSVIDSSTADQPEKLAALRQRAEAYYWANRFEPALADLDAALVLDPASVPSLRRRGWTNFALRRLDESLRDLSEALSREPQNADVLFALGFVLSNGIGAQDAAVAAFEQGLASDPNHYLTRASLAAMYFYRLQEVEKAFAQIDAIIAANQDEVAKVRTKTFGGPQPEYDDYADVRLERSAMLAAVKRYGAALEDANWVIQKYPDAAKPYAMRAEIHRDLQDNGKALADADMALARDPRNEQAQVIKLHVLSRLERNEDLAEFATSIIDNPTTEYARGNAFYFRGRTREDQNDRAGAIADIEQSFDRAPFYLELMLQRMKARGYYDGEQTDEYGRPARVGLEACMIDPEC